MTSTCLAQKPDAEQHRFFEEKVRPLLVQRCFRCHSEKKHEASLRLDAQSTILAGGDSGPAVISGKPGESLLIDAVRYRSLEMPPDGRLSQSDVEILVKWVRMGVPWPDVADDGILVPRRAGLEVTDKDREYWAFRPIQRPEVPDDPNSPWDDDNPVDGFVAAKLAENELFPSVSATRRQLVRRLYFDLIGIPPTYEEVEQFVADKSLMAFRNLVNELLDRPQYGERWGRHWLDVVRFAQTNGYERDAEKPYAWRYRDYVIKAFNDDKPFNRFVIEQLAGDELDDVTHDSIIATGYYRIGVWDDEPDDKTAAVHDGLADIVRTTGEAFLGLTIGCARCHDHKFDPIPQTDYYGLLSFFRNITPYGKGKSHKNWILNPDAVLTPLLTAQSLKDWEKARSSLIRQMTSLKNQLEAADGEQRKELEKQIAGLDKRSKTPPWEMALSVREPGNIPPETRVLIRGNHLMPGPLVEPSFLTVVGGPPPEFQPAVATPEDSLHSALRSEGVAATTRRRRVLAEWIAGDRNPLTARVIVNRLWHYHFGQGIVATPNDFGETGRPPSHPRLLDWLAAELIDNNWSLKHLHRTILQSKTWQQSSKVPTDHPGLEMDPENQLLWRQNLRRVEAEVIRDSMLTVSGQLNPEMGGRGFFPELSAEVLSTQSMSGRGWGKSDETQRSRRSVYIYSKRTLGVPMMEAFDTPVPDRPEPVRQTTTIAPQALILLNSHFVDEQSAALARRLLQSTNGSHEELCRVAFQVTLSRNPSAEEEQVLASFLARYTQGDVKDAEETAEKRRAATELMARLVLNLNEFVYVD